MAMVLPVLSVLLFGIIEVGMLVRDVSALNQLAREGARCAVVGDTPSSMIARIAISDGHLDGGQVITLCEYRTFNEAAATFGAWTALGSDGSSNNAVDGDQVRVTLRYPHVPVTGLFTGLTDGDGIDTLRLDASVTMRRE